MTYDPISNTQLRALRTDPTGRFNPITDPNDEMPLLHQMVILLVSVSVIFMIIGFAVGMIGN